MALSDRTETGGSRSPIGYVGVIGLGVAAILLLLFGFAGETPTSQTAPASNEVAAQRPTGAGTNPDGAADEPVEGLVNQTSTDTFLGSTANTDASPLEGALPNDGPDPSTSAEGLAPAVGSGDSVERMLPEDSGN